MAFNYPRSGPGNVGEYQTSGLPWVTSSAATATPVRIDFPYVTNQITFQAGGGTVRFGFTQNGVNGTNYIPVYASGSLTVDLRTKQLWVRSESGTVDYSVLAGLTQIQFRDFPVLTGSAIYNSASVTFEYGYGQQDTPGAGTGLG